MQLREYIEQATQYEEGLTIREKIEVGRKKLFNFSYPFFDEDYRAVFETNFIRKFYMREIGFETEETFKFYLETWLTINMPYYNRLFQSEEIDYDPLTNAQMMTAHEQKKDTGKVDERITNRKQKTDEDNKTTANQKTSAKGTLVDDNFERTVGSENPDSRLQLQTLEGKGVIEYASDIDEVKANNKSNTTDEGTRNEDINYKKHLDDVQDRKDNFQSDINEMETYIERRYGKIGADSYAKLIQEYRSALLRIENQIHSEMQELFMLVY